MLMKRKFVGILLCILFLLSGCGNNSENEQELGQLKVTFMNVGQGDAILLECNGHNMLIDGGSAYTNNVYLTLQEKNITDFDYVFCTHADEDNIGGLTLALEGLNVGKYFCSSADKNTKAYINFMSMIEQQNKKLTTPKAGDTFKLSNAIIEVLAVDVNPRISNDSSIVLKVTFGDCSFLFTGDAETETIDYLMKNVSDLRCDVLKIAHHGAEISSPKSFISSVQPRYAVISVGANNKYNHPDEETTTILSDLKIETYITSVNGSIIFETNGKNLVHSFK